MGSMDDSPPPPRKSSSDTSPVKSMVKVLLLIVTTNILTIYLLSSPSSPSSLNLQSRLLLSNPTTSSISTTTTSLLLDLNATRHLLAAAQIQISELTRRLKLSNSLSESLLSELGRHANNPNTASDDAAQVVAAWPEDIPPELNLAIGPHALPLGYSPNIGSDKLYPPLGLACQHYQEEVFKYMTYETYGECPSDDVFAQRLMLKGCEPLPRRRCRPKSPVGYTQPAPLPESLWSIPSDTSIVWDPYTCKNYTCLVNRNSASGSYDCKDCFDILRGRERARWTFDSGGLDYGIDGVLRTRPEGTVRIGLDLGGGTGTFAARMRERNVTVVTSTMNFDGPFNSFIASRGLVPMHVSIAQRLPFFEGTLDIVHSMHVLSNWIPDTVLEFALFDIYRVLRPGGLFWLDHFFCLGDQLNATYVPMFDRIGFNKLRWNAGRKLDRGIEKNEWYISALLEKPMT
ncbi:hypothetical protein QJS10_CPB13g01042 [Acorus calamus]|uniref:Methyltransferase type 11 domain-containing protein n=1 Tax=Acorus calamus TaxID=4465 RepID=A0AAV9DI19_ACOCL|nr:hypothetical protein QJS10_CPB13g01042 [Acorus calamus]